MSKKRIFWLIALILLILLIVGSVVVWLLLRTPLSPPLNIDKPTPTKSAQAPSEPTATAVHASEQGETCGHSGAMTFLLLARDISAGQLPYGADMIRLVQVDFSQRTVHMIAIPRDLWVSTPHLDALQIENSRLGPIFYYVEQNTPGTQEEKAVAATSAVAQALLDNFQVSPDHYIFFEMRYFADALNLLGGVDIDIPRDLTYGGYDFQAGPQHLDGPTALLYARLLPGDELSDGWDRLERQNIVLRAIWGKLLDPANIILVPSLIEQFKNYIVTDLSPALIADLTCMIDEVPRDQLVLSQIEARMISGPGPDDSMLPNVEEVTLFLQQQLELK